MTGRVLDLFAGLKGWSSGFGSWEVVTLDIDPRFGCTITADILEVTAADLPGPWDLILASPPCEAFTVAAVARNWWAIGPCDFCGQPLKLVERGDRWRSNVWEHLHATRCDKPWGFLPRSPFLEPKTDLARRGQAIVYHTLDLVGQLNPRWWLLENPVAMMRRLERLRDPALDHAEITYCRYGEDYRKPTDLWGRFPPTWQPQPPCKTRKDSRWPLSGGKMTLNDGRIFVVDENGVPCHESAPRGSRAGVQGLATPAARAKIPFALSDEIRAAAEAAAVTSP